MSYIFFVLVGIFVMLSKFSSVGKYEIGGFWEELLEEKIRAKYIYEKSLNA